MVNKRALVIIGTGVAAQLLIGCGGHKGSGDVKGCVAAKTRLLNSGDLYTIPAPCKGLTPRQQNEVDTRIADAP